MDCGNSELYQFQVDFLCSIAQVSHSARYSKFYLTKSLMLYPAPIIHEEHGGDPSLREEYSNGELPEQRIMCYLENYTLFSLSLRHPIVISPNRLQIAGRNMSAAT